jgi:hypothetical protein
MASSTSNRFEALSEEEEIDFEEGNEFMSTSGSDAEKLSEAPMDVPGRAVSSKKMVSFKVAKKRDKRTKRQRSDRTYMKVDDSSPQAPNGASLLYSSSLASTFSTGTFPLVPLSGLHGTPSGRGGRLNCSPKRSGMDVLMDTSQDDIKPVANAAAQLTPDERYQNVVFGEEDSADPQFDQQLPSTPTTGTSSLQQALVSSTLESPTTTDSTLMTNSQTNQPATQPSDPMQSSVNNSDIVSSVSQSVSDSTRPTTLSRSPITTPEFTTGNAAQATTLEYSSPDTSAAPMSTQTTPTITPSQVAVTTNKPKGTLRLHTFHAQLTFGLKPSQKVNIADQFTLWIEASLKLLGDFALLPFDGAGTTKITAMEHIRWGDPDFFSEYYGNHRSLVHGNLTGMVHFQTSSSWNSIKAFKSRYFSWLTDNRVFLNYTKFKTETLVPCGFFVRAHPGYLRRDEAEEELHASLGLDPGEIPFQRSSRSVSVPIKEDDTRHYSFNAVVVETSTKHATKLRERFYDLQDPRTAIADYPYTGLYQFVPMVKSTDWPISKIYQLAHLHSSIIDDLKAMYVHNIQDVNNVIDDSGFSLLQGFYGMTVSGQATTDPKERLLHSIHNTSRMGVKLALVSSSKYKSALGQFTNLKNILTNCVNSKYHSSVFVTGSPPKLSGRQVDSISSGNYSSYADSLLMDYNPQTGDGTETSDEYVPPVVKRYRPAVLTYAQAAAPTPIPSVVVPSTPQIVSSVSQDAIDKMFESFSQKFSASLGSSLTIQDLENQVKQTSGEIQEVKASFQSQIQTVIDPKGLRLSGATLSLQHDLRLSHDCGVAALCLPETNTNWDLPLLKSTFSSLLHKTWRNSMFSSSKSPEDFLSNN